MYQAIVFLPLLGAILAGIISLVGAHARHPGGSMVEGADRQHRGDAEENCRDELARTRADESAEEAGNDRAEQR